MVFDCVISQSWNCCFCRSFLVTNATLKQAGWIGNSLCQLCDSSN